MTIPGWRLFTILGWLVAGIAWWEYRYGYPNTPIQRAFLTAAFLAAPSLFQAIPVNRVLHRGWLWAAASLLIGVLMFFIWDFEEHVRRMQPVTSGLAISPARFAELIDTCRNLERVDNAASRLLGLTIPG